MEPQQDSAPENGSNGSVKRRPKGPRSELSIMQSMERLLEQLPTAGAKRRAAEYLASKAREAFAAQPAPVKDDRQEEIW